MANASQAHSTSERPYKVSPQAHAHFRREVRRAQRRGLLYPTSRDRYWRRHLRAQSRNWIRDGLLITHRRMFGVSHKSVQPGQRTEQAE